MSQERATICPYCKHENVALQVYCSHCERPLRREAPSPRKRKRTTKVILEPAPYLRVLGAQVIDLLTLGVLETNHFRIIE